MLKNLSRQWRKGIIIYKHTSHMNLMAVPGVPQKFHAIKGFNYLFGPRLLYTLEFARFGSFCCSQVSQSSKIMGNKLLCVGR